MSYYDQIENNRFEIKTGDGKTYFPYWKGGTKEIEYNTSMFDFINVTGTLVDRKKPRSPFFNLTFWFQGEDYLNESLRFEVSSADSRPWVVVHPIYGEISGQPLSLKRDDANLNIVEFTVPFWESIEADYPFLNFNIKDNTREKHARVYAFAETSFGINNPIVASDIPKLKESLVNMSGFMKDIQDNTTFSEFQNQLNKGLKAIDNVLDEVENAMGNIQAFLDLPSTYVRLVEARLSVFESIYTRLKETVESVVDKKYFESIASSLISSMCVVSVNPIKDSYLLVSDVFNVSNRISTIYDDYISYIYELQTSDLNVNNSYLPDASLQLELKSLVQFTVSNLYVLSFDSKREKIILVDKDTNPILLVHRYIGLNHDDTNLSDFIVRNNLKLKELFSIKKGREIKFIM